MGGRSLFRCILCIAIPYRFQVGCPKNLDCKTAKVSRDLNPPIESKLLDSIGGFKSCDTLQFCILSLDGASNKKHGTDF